jgi:hypothetical protein
MARTYVEGPMARAKRQAETTVRGAMRNVWMERLARFGYAARGLVYAVIGLLAVQTAFSGRGSRGLAQNATPQGALRSIAEQSRILLALVAVGLAGYALWRFVQGGLDPEKKGTDAKGLAQRGAMLAGGVVYAGLALAAARLASGDRSGTGGGSQSFTADLMSKPYGRWVVVLAGIAVMVAGSYQLYDAWSKKFRDKLKLREMSADEARLATHTGQLGLAARGIVFLMSGWFLVQTGLRFKTSGAQGLGGALATLARQPSGPWLLGLVAFGLIAFGAYSFLQARYRRMVF